MSFSFFKEILMSGENTRTLKVGPIIAYKLKKVKTTDYLAELRLK